MVSNCSTYYSGTVEGRNGVGIIVEEKWKDKILKW